MEHIRGTPREQITLFPDAIEDYITEENAVRFIDAFVDKMDVVRLGFKHARVNATGAPPYAPKDLLKLYLYGYLNRIRTSRVLERETQRNVEVMWLMRNLSPDHKTIADFRKDNPDALRGVFKKFVVLCRELELFGNELVAIDSTKFKASNARSRVLDKKGVEKSLKGIEKTNIMAESFNKQLQRRFKTIEAFQTFPQDPSDNTAFNYLNLIRCYLRFKPYTDCRGDRKHRNGKSPLQLCGVKLANKDWLKNSVNWP